MFKKTKISPTPGILVFLKKQKRIVCIVIILLLLLLLFIIHAVNLLAVEIVFFKKI